MSIATTTGDAVGGTRQGGREQEFADFFGATWSRLFRAAYGVAGDAGLAEDCLQAAYAKAYAAWAHVRQADHPEAYVRRMAVNEVLSALRRPWRRAERASDRIEAAPVASHETGTVDRDAVWRAVSALPPRQRAVVVLRYYEGLSEAEIADVLGCARGTVKSQASDALAALRRSALAVDDGADAGAGAGEATPAEKTAAADTREEGHR